MEFCEIWLTSFKFLHSPADEQTNRRTKEQSNANEIITSLAEVMKTVLLECRDKD